MSDASHAVFLSYAREDTIAARRIVEALRGFGVEVWFDQNELTGGDAWDQKIRGQIKDCAIFAPVISAHTEARGEGYFRLEWKLADERTHLMAKGVPFLLPIVIDDTSEADAMVPDSFRAVQWARLPGGAPTPEFVALVKRLLAAPRRSGIVGRGLPTPPRSTADGSPTGSGDPALQPQPRTSRFSIGLVATLGVVVLALVAFILLRPATKETSVVPSPAKATVVEAKTAPAAPASVVSDKPAPADKSIAVLPFENLSEDKENTAFFSDGMQEDILTNLANIPELRVVSRTSVMEYRNTTKKIPQIARELGVAYILEGSVRRAGNQVRITGQLIRAADDVHLWAKSYDRELTPKEMFAIQAALSTEIAGALQAAISPGTKKLLERQPTNNLAAYEAFLKARLLTTTTLVSLTEREKFLQTAVDLDPNFAEAWGELAVSHAAHVFQRYDVTPARLAQADAAMARAIRLAPESLEVVRLLGVYAYNGYRDYPRATAQFEKVIGFQPNNAAALFFLGAVQRRQGRWLEGLRNMRKATELDPGNINAARTLVQLYRDAKRWGEAVSTRRRLVALQPASFQDQVALLHMEWYANGSTKQADDWLAGLSSDQFASQRILAERKFWARVKGDYAGWKRLDSLQPYFDEDGTPHWSQAIEAALIFAAQGDMAGAAARLGSVAEEVKATLEVQPANDLLWGALALMEAVLGKKEEALRDAHKAVELLPEALDAATGPSRSYNLAAVYAWTGDKDRAITELTRLVRVPGGVMSVHELRVDPRFAPLRGDPRFEALLNDPKNNAPLF